MRSDRGPAFTGEIIQWITEMEGISLNSLRFTLNSLLRFTLKSLLKKMKLKDEQWDLYLQLAQHFYNTMPRPMF